jgi:leucyl/phenylalanyl-tRNA--protein transferase
MTGPTPLPPTPWHFPHPDTADPHGVVGIGADLEPSTLVHAYASGLFPMPANDDDDDDDTIAWWSPPSRGVLDFADLRMTRSLRQSCRRYHVTANQAFDRVIGACADLPRDGGWISPAIIDAYERLHELGWAHSIETWHDGELVGGLYGVQVGGLFAGESMFHLVSDASKVALVALVSGLEHCGAVLLDVQWTTDHLATLGVSEIARKEYLERLHTAVPCQASSLAVLSGQDSLGKTAQFLDRILSKPTGSTPLPYRSTS